MTTHRDLRSWLPLAAVAVGGAAIVALSFLSGWLVHDRTITGEGYRHVLVELNAWSLRSAPVLSAGIIVAALVATYAGGLARWPRASGWPLLLGAAACVGILAATAIPLTQTGHNSSVRLSPGPVLAAGLALSLVMVVAALLVARPGRVATLGLVAVMAVILAGATGGRWLGLNLAEGDGRHYTAGTYTRISADGTAMTLTIDGAGYRFDDRWSGSLEGSGLVAVLVGDPACPDARGAYHVWAAGGEDIRWEMIVDTCADGARAADVVGTWARAR